MTERWVGVGRSAGTDSATAGAEARATALDGRADARLLIVFASPAHDFAALLAGIAAGDVPLVGCSTAGEIATGGPGTTASWCSRSAAPASRSAPRWRRARRSGCARPAREVAALPGRRSSRVRTASCSCSATASPATSRRSCAARTTSPARRCRSSAGARATISRCGATFSLYGDQVLRDAVVGVAIGSDAPIGIGVRHGWRRVGEPMLVTAQRRQPRLHARRPARARRLPRAPRRARRRDPADVHPLRADPPARLGRRSGEDHVRFVGEADFEDRSLGCIAAVPAGRARVVHGGRRESVLERHRRRLRAKRSPRSRARPPLGVLAFDCIARRGVLGATASRRGRPDRRRMPAARPSRASTPTARSRARAASAGFHNQTLVVLAVG